jgi:hypothetical protein
MVAVVSVVVPAVSQARVPSFPTSVRNNSPVSLQRFRCTVPAIFPSYAPVVSALRALTNVNPATLVQSTCQSAALPPLPTLGFVWPRPQIVALLKLLIKRALPESSPVPVLISALLFLSVSPARRPMLMASAVILALVRPIQPAVPTISTCVTTSSALTESTLFAPMLPMIT